MQEMIDYIRDFIEKQDAIATKLKTRFPFRKLAGHCYRSYRWAQRINEIEKGDMEIVEIGSLFHDIGKCVDSSVEGHAREGAKICADYLRSIGFDKSKIDVITHVVRNHIHTKTDESMSLEQKIVRDADLLDEVGAITVLWDAMATAMATGAEQDQSYEIAYERIRGAYENLCQKPLDLFETETAKSFFEERLSFLREYVHNLEYELGLRERPHEES
jgi:uncharacterized protein